MFNFGWGELVVIGIVALIAIGPKELPTVLRTIGQWTGKIRRMANEFQGQFQEALREAELGDLQKHAEDLTSEVASIANINPLAEEQRQIERIGEGAGNLPSDAVMTGPTATTAEPAAALPDISVLPPQLPPPPSEKDFAAAKPAPTKRAPKSAVKTASSSPKRKPKSRPGGGAHE
jgi:sec-independent protein translocase protein TatB